MPLNRISDPSRALKRMGRIELEGIILAIYLTMDRAEWDSNTTNTIADIMKNAGLPALKEPN